MAEIVTTTVRDQIYNILLNSIVTNELQPGERIVEDDLARKYDVSRTPLRESLHRLEQDGLLTRLPKRGLAVSDVSADEAKEICTVRSYLEGLATKLATENLTDAQVEKLRALRGGIDFLKAKESRKYLKEFGHELHSFIIRNCKNHLCVSYLMRMNPLVARYKNIGASRPGRPQESFEEHIAILDYMIARDADSAEMAMRRHTEVALKGSIEVIEKSKGKLFVV